MKLYEVADQYRALMNAYELADNDTDREEILQEMLAADEDITAKAENYARLVKNVKADADAYAVEIKRLQMRKRAAESLEKRLKDNLLIAMEIVGSTEIKTSIGKWRVQKSPLSVNVLDLDKVPARFLIEQEPKVDARAILDEFKETGELFDGVEITQSEYVRFS